MRMQIEHGLGPSISLFSLVDLNFKIERMDLNTKNIKMPHADMKSLRNFEYQGMLSKFPRRRCWCWEVFLM